ncbi:MAG: N-6 DNA methylase [bacterium]
MKGLKEIFDCLGMNNQNGLYVIAENKWQELLPDRTKWLIEEKLKPIAFFCIEKKPIVLFYDSPEDRETIFKAIWNFNESSIVIINEPNTVDIFNGLSYIKEKKALEKLEDGSNLNLFSYFELVTGKTWEKYEKNFEYQKRVDYSLLENIKSARDVLTEKYKIESWLANALIGKCIFIRYLIDRKVKIKFDGELREWTGDEFCKLLKDKKQTINFLRYLKDHFNGDAFIVDDDHLNNVSQEAFDVLSQLMQGAEMASGQRSLFNIYDFSIIPVEFISNVYEHFIGSENQKKKGAYYTPLFLVNYIISETIEKYFATNPKEYNCKILDPACGSGVFLVEGLRRMIEQYQKINNISAKKDTLKKIAEDNIFGIDQDDNAINVAIFSVYLALLDYLKDPKEIENFEFPKLKTNKNFFTNDFFDQKADFNDQFKEIKFDFILGNPPWKRGGDKKDLFMEYIGERKKKEFIKGSKASQIDIGNKEIAQAFLLRTSDFSTAQTKCALIVTSKTLYNLKAKKFRKYFLHNYFIDRVFELAPVGEEVFRSANTPAAVLFYRYSRGNKTDQNVIEYIVIKPNRFFSLFKVLTIQKNDYKQVVQSRLKEYDWLWKVLVYGSYLDFNFIKRLKSDYSSIDEKIKNDKLLYGQGIIIGDKDKIYNTKHLIGKPLIDHKKDIEQFSVSASLKWVEEKVTRERKKELFEAPILLIKHGLKRLKAITAILYSDALYQHSLTGIKGNLTILRTLCGLLNSDLFAYYMINDSSAGIDRGRAHDEEKLGFPYITNLNIANCVEEIEEIEEISKELLQVNPIDPKAQTLNQEKLQLIDNMNDKILKSFDLNEQELSLVDYAITITIPLIMKHKGCEKELFSPLKLKDPFLENYAEVFLSRFKNSFGGNKKTFTVQILHNNYIIGMFFRVTDVIEEIEPISWENKPDKDILSKLSSLGCHKITEELFIQKDIRGFEKNGFYVIKPNEKKLWHKAIAYLDVEEFADAILRAGREVGNA